MKNKDYILKKLDDVFNKINDNSVYVWQDDLKTTKEVVILEDFQAGLEGENKNEYNSWFEDLKEIRELINNHL